MKTPILDMSIQTGKKQKFIDVVKLNEQKERAKKLGMEE